MVVVVRGDWAVKKKYVVFEFNVIFVYNTPKKTECSKKNQLKKQYFVKIGQNNVKLRTI